MIVIKADKSHVTEIEEIEKSCFSRPWSQDSINSLLESENASVFISVSDDNGAVTGFSVLETVLDEGYLTNIAVSEIYRRNGVALMLLNAVIDEAQSRNLSFITLEVRRSNTAALSLYEKSGFTVCGTRCDYYTAPREDAVLMTKYLEEEQQ